MTIYEHAARLWPTLVLAARNRQTLVYETVGHLLGQPPVGVGGILGPIQEYCEANSLPALTVLVVGKETGEPGGGFHDRGERPAKLREEVFAYDWLSHPPPSAAELEAATSS